MIIIGIIIGFLLFPFLIFLLLFVCEQLNPHYGGSGYLGYKPWYIRKLIKQGKKHEIPPSQYRSYMIDRGKWGKDENGYWLAWDKEAAGESSWN